MTAEFTKQALDAMMVAMGDMSRFQPDKIIMSAYSSDTLKAEIDVLERFAGRDWRRIKRERRKAHAAVKLKHRHRPQVAFAVDSAAMTFNWSRQMKIDRW